MRCEKCDKDYADMSSMCCVWWDGEDYKVLCEQCYDRRDEDPFE